MIKRLWHKIKSHPRFPRRHYKDPDLEKFFAEQNIYDKFRHEVAVHEHKEEDSLYNAMIIALVIGIIVVIGTLFFLRPTPEYFTELYYTNHSVIPDTLVPGEEYSMDVTIANHEESNFTYELRLIIISENSSTSPFYEEIELQKDEVWSFTIPYTMPHFKRAKVITQIDNKNQEIHFFVNNENTIMEYPEGIGYTDCLDEIKIEPSDSFSIRAKGQFSPNMRVRLNGIEILNTTVVNAEYADFNIGVAVGAGVVDIIFDNDYSNVTEKIDRNLLIDYVTIGTRKIIPSEMTFDSGKFLQAHDCQGTRMNPNSLNSNGALRIRLVPFEDSGKYFQKVPQLTYQRLFVNATNAQTISVDKFKEQVKYLKDNGFNPITFKEYYSWREKTSEIEERSYIMVFDDEDLSVYNIAYPILKANDMKAVVAVAPDFIGRKGKMNVSQLKVLMDSGWEIASHSNNLTSLASNRTCNEICQVDQYENSRDYLKSMLQADVKTFIYPYNSQNLESRKVCMKYYSGCSGRISFFYEPTAFYLNSYDDLTKSGLPRIRIEENMTMQVFQKVVSGDY